MLTAMNPADVHGTLKKHMLVDGLDLVFDLKRSQGSYIYDSRNGRRFLDFFSFFATQPVGLNHPRMVEPAFKEKMAEVAIHNPSNSDVYTVPMAEFVDTFDRVAIPQELPYLFLVAGGSVAVENALKTAFDWKVRKNLARGRGEKGSLVLHFREAFHGRTGYSISMTNTADPRKTMYFPKFDWPRIDNPKLRFPVASHIDEVIAAEKEAVRQIEKAVKDHPDEIAALIIEPIQGEGGDNHFRPEFFAELRRLADQHDFLFIVDEIQSGMGITGKMWAMEHMGVQPDIIVFGKKAQVCGIIVGPRIDEVKDNVFQEESRINSTWGGDVTDMVRSTRFLEIIHEDKLLEHTARMGEVLMAGLQSAAASSKGFMTNIRGRGMMVAFDVPDKAARDAMIDRMKDNGMYALKSGNRSIRFRGMLDTPAEIIDKAVKIVEQSLPKP